MIPLRTLWTFKQALHAGTSRAKKAEWSAKKDMVHLFPSWIIKHIRRPNIKTANWLKRPVEVFHVPPKMGKLEIKEYLRKLYGLPVTAVHTAIYEGKRKISPQWGRPYKTPAYKKAYVYLADEHGSQKPRYQQIEAQLTPEAIAAWPVKPNRLVPNPTKNKPRRETGDGV